VYAKKGINRGAGKHPGYGPTPVAGDGNVFHLGTSGRLYAVELATGKPLWEASVPGCTEVFEEIRRKTSVKPDAGTVDTNPGAPSTLTPLMYIDGVVMVPLGPDLPSRLHGFDGATGNPLWQIENAITVPTPAKINGTIYGLSVGGDQQLRLFKPRTGDVLWTRPLTGTGDCGITVRPIAWVFAEGKLFAPRGAPKGPVMAAYDISEAGAKLAWTSDFPNEFTGWYGYRDGHFYASSQPRQMAAIRAVAGKTVGTFVGADRAQFYIWGDRLVVLGDNHHESIGSDCTYQTLSTDLANLKLEGRTLSPRRFTKYAGVCGYEIMMRDPFADGFLFTRAIDRLKSKGVILGWDLSKDPK
jgi:outer membrane protein assembly factor BamB